MKRILSLLLALTLLTALLLPALAEEAPEPVELPEAAELAQTDAESTAGAAAESSGLPELRIRLAEGLTLAGINAGSKDTKYPGNSVTLVNADGSSTSYENVELKGRGNFTWSSACEKKPYQIKFDSKTKVFGMDKAKKWVLLANQGDCTLMRNMLAFDLARQMGMPYTPECVWADVYVNDEYIGNYLVSEKNEVGSNRVPLEDDYGVLCELDCNYGTSEDVYYTTPLKGTVVVLSDSVADDVGEENSVSEAAFAVFCEKLSRFEALLNDKNTAWEQIEELIDVESFIKYYFIQELTEDSDGCRSSFYLWSDGVEDVIHLGPVWDYDISMGAFANDTRGGNAKVDYTVNIDKYMGSSSVIWFRQLFAFHRFDSLAVEMYNNEIRPVFDSIPSMIAGYLSDELLASADMNFAKWNKLLGHSCIYGDGGRRYLSTYAAEVDYLQSWLAQRVSYLNSRYATAPAFYAHKNSLVRVAGQPSTCTEAGWRDYYLCSDPCCARCYEDAAGKKPIADLEAWKTGSGALALSDSHADSDRDGKCDLCGKSIPVTDPIEEFFKAINPVNIINRIIELIRDFFSRLF